MINDVREHKVSADSSNDILSQTITDNDIREQHAKSQYLPIDTGGAISLIDLLIVASLVRFVKKILLIK